LEENRSKGEKDARKKKARTEEDWGIKYSNLKIKLDLFRDHRSLSRTDLKKAGSRGRATKREGRAIRTSDQKFETGEEALKQGPSYQKGKIKLALSGKKEPPSPYLALVNTGELL